MLVNLKRFLSYILILIMVISNIIPCFASNTSNIQDNAGGQGNTSQAATSKGNGSFKIPANTGFRFTITDNQGHIVSYVDGKSGSLDVINSGVKQNEGLIYTGCVTDSSGYVKFISYDKFLSAIGATDKPLPQWVDSSEKLYGNDVRDWILKQATITQNMGGNSNSNNSGTVINSSNSSSSGGTTSETKKVEYVERIKSYIYAVPNISDYSTQNEFLQNLNAYQQRRSVLISFYLRSGYITVTQANELNDLLQNIYKQSHDESYNHIWAFLDNLFTLKSYASNDVSSTPSEAPDPNRVGWAWEIINLTEEISSNEHVYVFQLEGASRTKEEYEAGGKRPGDVFVENNYRLVVENTIQGRPQKYVAGVGPGASYGSLVYGTAHNWAVFGETLWKPWGGGDTFGNHQRYLTRMLPRAFVTVKDWGGVLSVPVDDDQWTITEMKDRYGSGYGTHVYSASELPTADDINTYDVKNNPIEDAPSEPSDGKEDPTTYGSKALTFNIDKHYRFRDTSTGEIFEISYYTTVNSPHTIKITDEKDKTGFALKDWFTSTDGWMPPSGGDASAYPWETIVKGQHKNGTYEGTGETTLIVQPTDPDNVLHLLYEYEGKPSTSNINTYDITTNPTVPAPSEPPTGKDQESDYGVKSLKFKIDKHYREKDPITGQVKEIVYHTTVNAPHTVVITDEKNKTGYALKDWFTSTDDWLPPAGGNAKDYPWETVVKGQHKNGQYSGTGETTLVVKPIDPDNVLHLLYEKSTVPTVIRVYDNEDGDTDKVEKDDVTEKPYKIPDGGSYEYVEVKTTPNSPKDVDDWSDSEGTSQGSPSRLDYPDGTKTIYVHYVKQSSGAEQTIKLYENELSYNYTLKDLLPNSNRSLIKIFDDVPDAPLSYASCPGHRYDCGSCHGGHADDRDCGDCHGGHSKRYCKVKTPMPASDRNWTIALKDNFNQNSLSFIKNWSYTSNMSKTGTASYTGTNGANTYVRPQAEFLLIRNKDKDVVTLYPELNNSVKSKLNGLGLSEGYTSNDTRYNGLRELTRTRKFFDTLFTDLDYSGGYDNHLSWKTKKSGYGSHTLTGTYYTSHASGHTPDVANEAYSKDNNVETHYFLGEAGLGDKKPSLTSSTWQKKFDKYNSNSDFVEDTLSFYPYLEYKYYDKGSSRANPVYVTSSNLSTMKVFNAYQIGVYKKNKINANLTSTQWSTHARSLSFLKDYGVSDKKSVLPGGAIQDIDMGNQGDTQIGLTLWQACLPDDVVVKVQNGFKTTVSQALSSVNTMKEEVKKSIEGYGLVQYGYVGASKDIKEILKNGEELHENISSSLVTGNGGKTSNDAKYYLRQNGTGGSRANFNVLANRVENQVLYTISSDTKGKVTLKKKDMLSGNEIELGYITKGQSASNLLNQSQEIKDLDANTKLITNFIQCIERNKGKDRSNNTWFNEAFNGVSVLMTNISYDVGFETNSATRTNVLDPLLVAKAESKSDLYNFEEDHNIRTSVYATTKKSTSVTSDVSGYLATVKKIGNMNDLVVNLTDIQSMVHTKNFYIPNATVSDLN